jgi:hypothetical protein
VVIARARCPGRSVHLQRPGGWRRRDHGSRRLRVLDLPTRTSPHGRD